MDFAKASEQVNNDGVKNLDGVPAPAGTTEPTSTAPTDSVAGNETQRTVEEEFKYWVEQVKVSPPNPNLTNDDKLKVYALFKQSTVGDVNTSQPWAVQLEARAKWDAWNAVKGKSKEEAMKEYAALVKQQMESLPK